MNFEAMLKFLLFVDSSGSLLRLKLSRSSRNQSIDFAFSFQISSSLGDPSCLTRIDSTISRRSCPQCRIPPPSSQLHILTLCLLGCSISPCRPVSCHSSCLVPGCSLMTSTHVSMHPSESSLNSFGFLKVFLDLPPPL